MSSTIGKVFTVTTFGESHGLCVGAVVDGCPSKIPIHEADLQAQLNRRRPGQSVLTTARAEDDRVQILSGVERGLTLGTPIALLVHNREQRPDDYRELANAPRPSHADYTYSVKYGIRSTSGGGRASARETVGRVAAGGVAEAYLRTRFGVEIVAWVSSVGTSDALDLTAQRLTRADVDRTEVRCPDELAAGKMATAIRDAAQAGDSLGGVVTCVCWNVPPGWGEPVFDKMEAALAAAMLSIPAARGFEIGSGFAGSRMRGSQHNDMFVVKERATDTTVMRLGTATNRSGGVQGGITNGEPIVMRIAFKPVATIRLGQTTVDFDGNPVTLKLEKGRHDPCVLPRAVPIVESMAALVLADMARLAG